MELDDGIGDEYWTHKAWVKEVNGDRVVVVDKDGKEYQVTMSDLKKMNDPVSFKSDILGNI